LARVDYTCNTNGVLVVAGTLPLGCLAKFRISTRCSRRPVKSLDSPHAPL